MLLMTMRVSEEAGQFYTIKLEEWYQYEYEQI